MTGRLRGPALADVPTWVWEQIILVACLAVALYGQAQAAWQTPGRVQVMVSAITAAVGAFAAQKVRSGADRQREQNELRGIRPAELRCAARIDIWADVAQFASIALMMSAAATSSSWWGVPALAYNALYRPWRWAYRLLRPAAPEVLA